MAKYIPRMQKAVQSCMKHAYTQFVHWPLRAISLWDQAYEILKSSWK